MNLNETAAPQSIEAPQIVVAAKIDTLTAQKNAIDAASTGSSVFLSAAAYLAAHPKVPAFGQ